MVPASLRLAFLCGTAGLENYTAIVEHNIEYVNTPVQLGVANAEVAWVGIQQTLAVVHQVRSLVAVLSTRGLADNLLLVHGAW